MTLEPEKLRHIGVSEFMKMQEIKTMIA